MKKTTLLVLSALIAFANSNFSPVEVKLNTIFHSEKEWMKPEQKSSNFINDENSYSSIFVEIDGKVDISENFNIMVGGKINQIVSENNYNSKAYKSTKMSSDMIDTTLIHEASINYDNGFFAVNLGRQDISFDWLRGSIDGALAMVGNDNSSSLRLFWFNNYYQLQYNYEVEIEDINNDKGMYGAIGKTSIDNIDLNVYSYYMQDLRNIYGGELSQFFNSFGYSLSHSEAKPLSLALYDYHESFTSLALDFMVKRNFIQFGYSKTGENGLLAMLQMGNEMYGQFYLGNQVDRENAENFYLKHIYLLNKMRFESVFGMSSYDNNFVRLERDLKSYEVDLYFTYHFSKDLSMDLGLMHMSVEGNDPLQVTQNAVMFNLVADYELF